MCENISAEISIFPKLISKNISQIRSGLNDGSLLIYHQLCTGQVICTILHGRYTKRRVTRMKSSTYIVYRPINRQASQLTLARLSSLISVDDLIQDDMRSNFNGTCTVKSQPQINGNIRARLLNTNK